MNAEELIGRVQEQKKQAEAIRALWGALFPEFDLPDDRQCMFWLKNGQTLDDVDAGLQAAAQKYNMILQKIELGEDLIPWQRPHVVQYASTCIKNAAVDKMTEEQKEERLSVIRSEAGKRGARSRWELDKQKARSAANRKAKKQSDGKTDFEDFATPLPSFATAFATSGLGLGLDLGSGSRSGTGSVSKTAQRPTGKTDEGNPKTENQNPNLLRRAGCKKFAKDGTPWPEDFDAWTNKQRTEWLMDHGQQLIDASDPDSIDHIENDQPQYVPPSLDEDGSSGANKGRTQNPCIEPPGSADPPSCSGRGSGKFCVMHGIIHKRQTLQDFLDGD